MPFSEVTVTPTFINATGLSVNIPKTGSTSITIPTGVKSLKVYDDGGATGNYSHDCDGTLTLTAPNGYILQLSGNITAESCCDKLTVYNGNEASGTPLLDAVTSTYNGTLTDITTVVSSGQSMTLCFHSDGGVNDAGLDLTVKVVASNAAYAIKGLGNVTGGTVTASVGGTGATTAKANQVVTLTVTPAGNYLLNDLSVTDANGNPVSVEWDNTTTTATFTMPFSEVTVTPTFVPSSFVDNGDDTYTILDTDAWNYFCDALEANDKGYFTGKTVKLDNDISVTRMAGSSSKPFTGTFDGNRKTLTVSYNATANDAAPFLYMDGGRIENLHVAGTINTSAKYATGLIAHQYGTTTIKNCHSSVAIRSNFSGENSDGTHGGFVAVSEMYATLTIEGCLFDGKLLTTGTTVTDHCAGFVGYRSNNSGNTVIIKNSLYAPAAAGEGETWVGTTESATFVRSGSKGTITTDNSYNTRTLGSAQGKQRHSVTAGTNVTVESIALTGYANEFYDVSGITAYSEGGLSLDNGAALYYGKDDQVSLTLSDNATDVPTGYLNKDGYTISAGTLSGSTLTMPDNDVVVSIRWAPDPTHFAVNADGTEYTIKTATGWNVFCDALDDNATYNRFSGKTVKLDKDISVTRMAGKSQHDFCGTFDGQGNTLTVDISSAADRDYTAPFSYISETTPTGGSEVSHPVIRNLKVAGKVTATKDYAGGIVGCFWGTLTIENCTSSVAINTNNKHAAGFISRTSGTVTITNCLSNVTITGTVNGDGTHAGFIGGSASGVKTTITGCAFTGSLLGANTTHCAGFMGYNSGTLTITNSLYAPVAPGDDETWVGTTESATFARGNEPTVTNSYYTATLGTAQGTQMYSITGNTGVTVANAGAVSNSYDVSGLTFYTTGIKCDKVLYAASGETVSLTLANNAAGAPDGYQYGGYIASAGTLGGNATDGYTLQMPNEDVTISVDPENLVPVPVQRGDANGDGQVTVTDIGVIVDKILGTSNNSGNAGARRMIHDALEPQ